MKAKRKIETRLRKNGRFEKTTRDVATSCFCEENKLQMSIYMQRNQLQFLAFSGFQFPRKRICSNPSQKCVSPH